ncbi:MAG: nucleotidyltransferase domain-containing protein [Candidatus Kariarchaeaceae archaeon]
MNLSHIPEPILDQINKIVQDFSSEEVESVILTGSYARGDFTEYSDVDITFFLSTPLSETDLRYQLEYRNNILFSLNKGTIEEWKKKLDDPIGYYGLFYAITDAKILLDKNNQFRNFQKQVENSSWEVLEEKRRHVISEEIVGFIEEVHKVVNGIKRNDESTMLTGMIGLLLGMSRVIAMQHKLLIRSENEFYFRLQKLMGMTSKWTFAFREVLALPFDSNTPNSVADRARASLRLYLETAKAVNLDNKSNQMVLVASKLIEQFVK